MSEKAKVESSELLEKLAELEHLQWMSWVKYVIDNYPVPKRLKDRWQKCLKPYSELTECQKEADRKWARKILWTLGEEASS